MAEGAGGGMERQRTMTRQPPRTRLALDEFASPRVDGAVTPWRVLVCGGRQYDDARNVDRTLDALDRANGPLTIIEGGQAGADELAHRWASRRQRPHIQVVAEWSQHGRAAGPIRNQRMIDEHHPDLVLAFTGGHGTADMVRRARAAGVPVFEAIREPASRGEART